MILRTASMTITRFVCLLCTLTLLIGCASRYRLDLYLTSEGYRKKIKVEEASFLYDTALNDPYARRKTIPGEAATVVVTTGTRWQQPDDKRVFALGFDEYLRCRLYLQLPPMPVAGTVELPGNSFVHLLGRFDVATESKIFLPESGAFVVDSITSKHLFGTIHGLYQNDSGAPIQFDGQLKIRKR
ncbi:MAG: hypothetical protein ABII79_07560 [bacterium]